MLQHVHRQDQVERPFGLQARQVVLHKMHATGHGRTRHEAPGLFQIVGFEIDADDLGMGPPAGDVVGVLAEARPGIEHAHRPVGRPAFEDPTQRPPYVPASQKNQVQQRKKQPLQQRVASEDPSQPIFDRIVAHQSASIRSSVSQSGSQP